MSKTEEIQNRIFEIREQIFDLQEIIASDACRYYSQLYNRLLVLEAELRNKERELAKATC